MEIRRYWRTIMRWWLVVAIVFVLAAVAAFLQTRGGTQYEAQATLVVRQLPEGATVSDTVTLPEDRLSDRYLASEYLVDDYLEIVRGNAFADTVAATLSQNPSQYGPVSFAQQVPPTPVGSSSITTTQWITPGMIYGSNGSSMGATRVHRILTLSAYSDDRMKAAALVRAGADALVHHASDFVQTRDQVSFSITDQPRIVDGKILGTVKDDRSKKYTNAALTAILGLLAGIALAFLLDYLDDRVRDGRDVQRQLSLPVTSVPLKGKLP